VDGVIKLSVNGKVVNGIRGTSQKKGYLCLESEGAEIHFRNIKDYGIASGRDGPGSGRSRARLAAIQLSLTQQSVTVNILALR